MRKIASLIFPFAFLFFAASLAQADFNPPGSAPPAGNVAAPIYSSGNEQLIGSLTVTAASGAAMIGQGGTIGIQGNNSADGNGLFGNLSAGGAGGGRAIYGLATDANDYALYVSGGLGQGIASGDIWFLQQGSGISWPRESDSAGLYGVYVDSSGQLQLRGHGNGIAFQDQTPATKMVILENGNVGIGETSPDAPLHLKPTNVSGVQQGMILEDPGTGSSEGARLSWQVGDHANINLANVVGVSEAVGGQLRFETNAADAGAPTTRMTINSSGKVGIGTASPNQQLHVKTSSGNAEIDIQSAGSPWWGIYQDDATDELRFWNTDDRFKITSAGTASFKSAQDDILTLQTSDDAWLYTQWLQSNGTRRLWMGLNNNLTSFNITPENGTNLIVLGANTNVSGDISPTRLCLSGTCNATWPSVTSQWTDVAGGINYSGGKVGIGTINPARKLSVEGNGAFGIGEEATSGNNPPLYVAGYIPGYSGVRGNSIRTDSDGYLELTSWNGLNLFVNAPNKTPGGGARALTVTNGGYVGIGAASPNKQLHVKTSSGNAEIDIQSAGSPLWGIYQDDTTDDLRFWNNAANRLVVTDTGDVGIGVDIPTAKLEVAGQIKITGGALAAGNVLTSDAVGLASWAAPSGGLPDGTNGQTLRYDVAGWVANSVLFNNGTDVGIGATTPSAKLHVLKTTEQLRLGYDLTNFTAFTVDSGGDLTVNTSGSDTSLTDRVKVDVGSSNAFRVQNGATIMLNVDTNNLKVGVGTSGANETLEVNGGAPTRLRITDTTANENPEFQLKYNTGASDHWAFYVDKTAGANKLKLWGAGATGADRITVDTSGNVGIGASDPQGYRLWVQGNEKIAGNLSITGSIDVSGADVAEEFKTDRIYEPGTVLVIGDSDDKSAKISNKEYDGSVIGVVSSDASVVIGKVQAEKKAVVAMIGVVKVKVAGYNGAIKKGNLLTTSGVAGYAMKATKIIPGTIIGKALQDFSGTKGEILVLVNLQ